MSDNIDRAETTVEVVGVPTQTRDSVAVDQARVEAALQLVKLKSEEEIDNRNNALLKRYDEIAEALKIAYTDGFLKHPLLDPKHIVASHDGLKNLVFWAMQVLVFKSDDKVTPEQKKAEADKFIDSMNLSFRFPKVTETSHPLDDLITGRTSGGVSNLTHNYLSGNTYVARPSVWEQILKEGVLKVTIGTNIALAHRVSKEYRDSPGFYRDDEYNYTSVDLEFSLDGALGETVLRVLELSIELEKVAMEQRELRNMQKNVHKNTRSLEIGILSSQLQTNGAIDVLEAVEKATAAMFSTPSTVAIEAPAPV
jgi:hypothetical protein